MVNPEFEDGNESDRLARVKAHIAHIEETEPEGMIKRLRLNSLYVLKAKLEKDLKEKESDNGV